MDWLDDKSPQAKANAEILVKRMNASGITNPYSQAGLLSIVSKESGFIPRNETTYANTSNERIRKIFGSRVASLSEEQLTALKKDDAAFYDQVYGMKQPQLGLGNTAPGDGYKYRGRGFNGITGKALYAKYGKMIGVDLVNNPDLANNPTIAADIVIAYFKSQFASPANKLNLYNSTGINDFKTVQDSTGAYYHANAGWNKSIESLQGDTTGGRKKAFDNAPGFLNYVKRYTGQTIDLVKKNPIPTILITAAVVISSYILYTQLKSK